MSRTIVEFKDISFSYEKDQKEKTLDQVSFHVKQGEWVSIVGHNGSGKSTTVRVMDGLLSPDQGEIRIDGKELNDATVWEIRQDVGFVFQNPDNQFVGATVEDDIAFGLENQGVAHEEMTRRVAEALKRVGMSEFRAKEPARLSGGQKQRVAIAGALALSPKLLILDEATSMLDPAARKEVIQLIQKLRQEQELTVVSITHDLDEVAVSDRVFVMQKGRLVKQSTPQELFSQPDQLISYGLDLPFTTKVAQALADQEIIFPESYLTIDELEDILWTYLLKK